MKRYLKDVDPAVFWGSAVLIAGFVGWGLFAPDEPRLGHVDRAGLGDRQLRLGLRAHRRRRRWSSASSSRSAPWGRIRLGPDDSRPEFGTFSWVSMMFAAGLGAGLLFYGIAEPVSHWTAPPHGLAEPQQREAALTALRYTYFHWGFNGWAMYAVMGGAMAYFGFRKNLPILVSATFTPVLGPNAHTRPIGRLVDALAIVATLFGTATALGLNGLQLNSGLDYLFDVPEVQHRRRGHHRRGHDPVPALGHVRRREGHQLPGEPRLVRDDRAVPVLPRRRRVDRPGHLPRHRVDRDLRHPGDPDVAPDRRGRRAVDGRLDDLLLGLVGLVGALRRHVRRPHLARPHHPRVHHRRRRRADRLRVPLVRGRRRHRHRAAAQRQGRHRRRAGRPRSCRCSPRSTRCPLPVLSSALCVLLIALFFISGADAAVGRDGDDGLARLAAPVEGRRSSCSAC